jgi:hypothetical protein
MDMRLLVRFVIGVMGLIAAYFTPVAAVVNSGDYEPADPEPAYHTECVWDGSYDACGGSR